ncbi:MAG: phytanoyl-CoA dioxygenase family protein [Proteobacteria bacterium]|nr:phytanoyl-CoA dioxygenase family protein [Pseudomonadota bacterium]MBI3496698.1 phytanoyl-CoA dioxygenase family protein [Pseudomonadota bacterium]
MSTALSPADVARYNRDGYLFPIDVLEPAEVASARAKLEGFEAKLGHPLERPLIAMAHLYARFIDDIIRRPRILDPVESLIGPDILCWECAFLTKEPAAPSFFSWHQDAKYWGLEPYEILTAWVALSPSTRESGCMQVMTGSHIGALSPHRDTFAADNMLSRGQEMLVEVDASKCVDVALEPGQMSLHHVKIAHGSGPNRAKDRRIGLVIRYVPAHVRQTQGEGDTAMLVRGKDRYGHFEPQPRPEGDFTEAGFAAHKRIIDKRLGIIMRKTEAA